MNYDERQWDILRAIRNGTKPEDMDPPVEDGYERRFYESHKAIYDDLKSRGTEVVWAPVCD